MAKKKDYKEQNELLNKAIIYAVEKHAGQLRKGTQIPYIVHPMEVLALLNEMRADRAELVRVKSGLVLGGMEGIPYRKETLTLGHGDKLFLYTDGVTEAENEFHELFTEKRLGTRLDLLRD